ncbi:MAG: PDDEXK nuclease domain-containing protein [Bacteroidales bacterium]|nr:PDDEXK nuclease domain-containing protein [Bacteroidales bacterium]
MNELQKREDTLFERISTLIDLAHKRVKTTIDTTMVYTYYYIGQYIVEDEQQGEQRAQYGKAVLKNLSVRLTDKYGEGWSVETLKKCRFFYLTYKDNIIGSTMWTQSEEDKKMNLVYNVDPFQDNKEKQYLPNAPKISETLSRKFENKRYFTLSWSHYLILMRINNPDARSFYEIECAQQQWSVRQLSRQVGSSLYERLVLSRDKNEVMRLATEGQTIEKPSDIIKNPLTLEFLGLKPDVSYSESKLENAIINKMQQFLLELGKGFLFEARQKRFTFDEQHFFVDLVFYNRLLQCYVLVDLKTDTLTHQDLGQMQMYVNYYDRYVKQNFEKPTIGILLCEQKNDALVELTLPRDANIYASAYQLYLPDKALLQSKVKEWIAEFKEKED